MDDSKSSGRLKVLLVIPAMVLGGSQRVYLTLMRHLDRARVEPHLAVLEATGFHLPDVPGDVEIHDLNVKHARHAVLPLARLCQSIKPHAVLSTSAHLNAAVIMTRTFMPPNTTIIVREGADITAPERHVSRIRLLIYRHLYHRADAVICQSRYMQETLVRDFALPASKVVHIYNPVDIRSITTLARSVPNPFRIGVPNLVYAGRLCREKGVDLLLRCMPYVLIPFPSARLTILGDGPDAESLRTLRNELGLQSCVEFAGEKRNPYPFFEHATCVVLPSRTEALPNVVLEALALGTPVVAFNCSGALAEIQETTRLLSVCGEKTSESLSAAIVECLRFHGGLKDPAEHTFVTRFGSDAVVDQYESLLQGPLPPIGRTPASMGQQFIDHPHTPVAVLNSARSEKNSYSSVPRQ